MKRHYFILTFTILLSLEIQGQGIELVRGNLVTAIKEKILDNSWILKESISEIQLNYIDTFFINGSISPLNNRGGWYNKLDTLYIKIQLEANWSDEKVDTLKIKQKAILIPLIEKYIAHYDSLNWRYMKSNKNLFLVRPISYLKYWDGLNKEEKFALNNLIRLPEKVIQSVGIFTEISYTPCGTEIEPEKVYKKVELSYKLFSEILGRQALYKCENRYY